MSTGMATVEEIDEALQSAPQAGGTEDCFAEGTSAYPALPEEMNLRTIPGDGATIQRPVGLSDHTMGIAVPVARLRWARAFSKSI